tara:strand:+ start:330 stop:1064 length:735 start_codon:yes stop_codon:yes gene_type:complete
VKNNLLITGASGNIGMAIIKKFYKKNYNIIAIDKNENNNLKKQFPKIYFFKCDLANEKSINKLFLKIEKKFKSIDILINNAGLIFNSLIVRFNNKGLKKHSYNSWKKVFSSNVHTTFLTSTYTVENMIKNRNKGLIINISSISAEGNIGQSAYSSSKAAIEAFSITLSKELSVFGIRVVAIAPGFFDVKSTIKSISDNQIKKIISATPSNRLGKIDELINAINFVINNKFFNGKILKIDGGLRV